MILLTFVGLLTALWLIVALPTWGAMRLVRGPGQLRPVARWTGISWLVGVPIAVFFGLPLLFSWLIANAGTRPDEVEITRTPDQCSRPFDSVTFASADGLELAGWYLPGEEGRVPLVMTHGLFRNRMELLDRACAFSERGHPLVVFDQRSHGLSGAGNITLGYLERLDVKGALAWTRETTGYATPVLLGVSMGAAASLLAAAEEPERVSAVIADSPFVSLRRTVRRHVSLFLSLPTFPFSEVFVWNITRIGGYQAEDLDLTRALGSAPFPILLIFGEEDFRMPPEDARQLADSLPEQTTELLFFPGANHGHAWDEDPERYLAAVSGLLARVAGP